MIRLIPFCRLYEHNLRSDKMRLGASCFCMMAALPLDMRRYAIQGEC